MIQINTNPVSAKTNKKTKQIWSFKGTNQALIHFQRCFTYKKVQIMREGISNSTGSRSGRIISFHLINPQQILFLHTCSAHACGD